MKTRTLLPWFICLFVGLVGWTAYAQNSRTTTPRAGWEYKVIAYISENRAEGFEPQMFEDGAALPSPVPNGLAKLTVLGAQGWELGAVLSDPIDHHRTQTRYYLKRPI
jgi:hypothetical protein